jgi:uncharacterized protein
MYIQRQSYLQQLIERRENGLVKVICGLRRCGKSFLLFQIYRDYLRKEGIADDRIIQIALDDDQSVDLCNPEKLSVYIRSKITDTHQMYYLFIDEIQYAISKAELRNHDVPVRLYSVLNGLMRLGNVDIYVTGSNSKMLATDILTEFRGRSDKVELHPLSFAEVYSYLGGDRSLVYEDYAKFGGMPMAYTKRTELTKTLYLTDLFQEVYFKDIQERHSITMPHILETLTDMLCSNIGSLTNVSKLQRAIQSFQHLNIGAEVIADYLGYLTESFLFKCAKRYDVKGKRYFEYPSKYYCMDIGLRNARLNFRQQEESHIMENIIFNELVSRGYNVDVGVVKLNDTDVDGKRHQTNCEIDFVINRGMKRYYIQSALNMPDEAKTQQELRPLLSVRDMFRKVIITKTAARPWLDENGVLRLGIYDFLLDDKVLDL